MNKKVIQKTVLIVEDEPWLASSYQRALRAAGYVAVMVRSADEAIVAVDDHPVDVIVLDMILPAVNGLQLLHELRSHVDLMALPVILCSSVQLDVGPDQRAAYGIDRVLAKATLTPATLVKAVREASA